MKTFVVRLNCVLIRLKVGQAADIIATPDNPLEKVETLKQVMFVMKNGTVIEK